MELLNANAVVAAHNFNPSILTQLWLVRNNVVAEEELLPGCLVADGVSQIETTRFMLIALPDRLQIVPRDPQDQDVMTRVISQIVTTLPHTPYAAVGLNFLWHHTPEYETIAQLTRRLFFIGNNPLYQEFDLDDANFGAYLSKSFGMMRLKLDIKPILLKRIDGVAEHRLQFSYNFHQDIEANPVENIAQALHQWAEAFEMSRRITQEGIGIY